MLVILQNVFAFLLSLIYWIVSFFSSPAAGFPEIADRTLPYMTVYSQTAQGDGISVNRSDYPDEAYDDPAFLRDLLNLHQLETISVEGGEKAEVGFKVPAGFYSLGFGDRPADVIIWKMSADKEWQKTEAPDKTASIRFGKTILCTRCFICWNLQAAKRRRNPHRR